MMFTSEQGGKLIGFSNIVSDGSQYGEHTERSLVSPMKLPAKTCLFLGQVSVLCEFVGLILESTSNV